MNFKKIFGVFAGEPKRNPPTTDSVIYALAFTELPRIAFGDPQRFIATTQARPTSEIGNWSAVELNLGKMAYIIEFKGSQTPAAIPTSSIPANKALLAGAVIDPHNSDATEYFVLVSSPLGRPRVRQVNASLSSWIEEGVDSLPNVDSFAGLLRDWRTPLIDNIPQSTNILASELDPSDYSEHFLDVLSKARAGDTAAMYGAAISLLTDFDGPMREDVAIDLLVSSARQGDAMARIRLEKLVGKDIALEKVLAGRNYNYPRL